MACVWSVVWLPPLSNQKSKCDKIAYIMWGHLLMKKFRWVWYVYLNNSFQFFWKYVWVKKCVKIRVILFKNWKYVFKHMYRTAQSHPSSLTLLANAIQQSVKSCTYNVGLIHKKKKETRLNNKKKDIKLTLKLILIYFISLYKTVSQSKSYKNII